MDPDNFDAEDMDDVEVIYLDDEPEEEGEDPEEMANQEGQDYGEEEEVEDLSKYTFTKHSKSVFSSALNMDNSLAVTGGEDDIAYIWEVGSGTVFLECTGHKDSVTEVCFNHDGQLVATGDMSGMIQVWSISEKKLIWCNEGDDIEWLMWHPVANALFSGSHSGDIYIWKIPQNNCKVLPSHGAACTAAKILPDGKSILAGYADGEFKLWDIKPTKSSWVGKDPESREITSIDINSEATLFALAPGATVHKMSDGKKASTFLLKDEEEVEAVVFSSDLNWLITGSVSGLVCVWDIGRQTVRHQARLSCAVTVVKLGSKGKVYIGAANGEVYVCDLRNGTILQTLTGHKTEILSICLFSDESSILTSSDDGTVKIFNISS